MVTYAPMLRWRLWGFRASSEISFGTRTTLGAGIARARFSRVSIRAREAAIQIAFTLRLMEVFTERNLPADERETARCGICSGFRRRQGLYPL